VVLEHKQTGVIAIHALKLYYTFTFKTTQISATNYMNVPLPGTQSDF